MNKRYPHTATIKINTEVDNGSSIRGVNSTDIEVEGRYEPSGQNKALDYSAKFYCKKLSIDQFEADGAVFIFEGKQFKITQIHKREIWLE